MNLLIVDDNPDELVAVAAALEPLDCSIATARSGREALRHLLARDFDLVLLDVRMPAMDGFETARYIRMRDRTHVTPILFLTGALSSDDVRQGYEVGAIDYLAKPVDATVLRSKVLTFARLAQRSASHRTSSSEPREAPSPVLLVHENPDHLLALEQALGLLGEDLVKASSGAQALKLMLEQEFAVVLLGVSMQPMNGLQTAAAIRDSPRTQHVPILLVSAVGQASYSVLEGYAAGAADCLSLPCEPSILRAKVAVFVELHKNALRLKRQADLVRQLDQARHDRELAEERTRRLEETARLKEELEKQEAEAAAARLASEFKSRFLARMSHELQAPIASIGGLVGLLAEDEAAFPLAEQRDYVERIRGVNRYMQATVSNLLDLARIEAGKMDLELRPAFIAELVSEVEPMAREMARQRSISLEVADLSALPEIRVDRIRFEQILLNLLSNAIKFTPAGGSVWLRGAVREGRVRLELQDTGVGIDARDLPRLFREFERIRPACGEMRPGSGLGLVLTKQLVELHGGTIDVRSEAGKGSTFAVEVEARCCEHRAEQ